MYTFNYIDEYGNLERKSFFFRFSYNKAKKESYINSLRIEAKKNGTYHKVMIGAFYLIPELERVITNGDGEIIKVGKDFVEYSSKRRLVLKHDKGTGTYFWYWEPEKISEIIPMSKKKEE